MELHYITLLPVTVMIAIMTFFIGGGRYRQLHDRIFLALLACCAVDLFITLASYFVTPMDYRSIIYNEIQALLFLSLFPLLFLYMRSVTIDTKWQKWYWWLFAPGIILSAAGTIVSFVVGWDKILAGRNDGFSPFVPTSDDTMENIYRLINVDAFNYIMLVLSVVLIILSIYYLIQYHKKANDFYANIEDSCIDSMEYFLGASILFQLTMLLGIIFTFIGETGTLNASSNPMVISLWISFISGVMSYYAYKIRLTKQNPIDERMEDALISQSIDDDVLGQRIAEWETRKDKPFCKEGITLVLLAKELGVGRQALSAYINSHKGLFRFAPEHLLERKNFNLWINSLRVEEAKRLLSVSKDPKIGYISNICGFGAQATFTRTFHKIVGMTPQDYRDTMFP